MAQYQLSAFADEASRMLSEQLEAMKSNGISLIEMRGVDGKSVADLTDEEDKEAKRKLDDAGAALPADSITGISAASRSSHPFRTQTTSAAWYAARERNMPSRPGRRFLLPFSFRNRETTFPALLWSFFPALSSRFVHDLA